MAAPKLINDEVGQILASHIKQNQSSITTINESINFLTGITEEEKTAWLATLKTESSSGEEGQEATPQIIIDNALSESSQNALQNRVIATELKSINAYITDMRNRLNVLENTSGGSFSSMFEINLSDVYHVTDESGVIPMIENTLNVDGFATQIGTSGIKWKKPTIVLPSTVNWSNEVDDNYDLTATVNVRIVFGEAGAVVKTVTLKKPGPGKVLAVMSSNNASIDTGVAANYSYTLHAKGYGRDGGTSVLIGGFVSTSERTSLRILPTSNKFQSQWPNNTEHTNAQTGIQVTSIFEYWQKAGSVRFLQNNLDVTVAPSGNTDSNSLNTNLFLLGDEAGTSRGYGTLYFAEVLNSNNEQVAYFAPYKLDTNGEIVIVNTAGLTAQQIYDIVEHGNNSSFASRIFRPSAGSLVETA